MPVETLFINGPQGGGKTTVARMVAADVLDKPAHYLKVTRSTDDHTNSVTACQAGRAVDCGAWASQHVVRYTADRVFETIPEALRKVRRMERKAFAILDADCDPALRHAYPYDYRMFVMGFPAAVNDVFRTPQAAAVALQQVMQDTASFASEIFGLFEAEAMEDPLSVEYPRPPAPLEDSGVIEHVEISESQIRQFLRSPLGGEIASRIQLQPDYHAMIESDVVLINTGVGEEGEALRECVSRLEKLLARVRHETRRHSVLYWGDVENRDDPTYHKLLRRLKTLFVL